MAGLVRKVVVLLAIVGLYLSPLGIAYFTGKCRCR